MTIAVPLPAGTQVGKSFEYGLDVNTGTTEAKVWQPVRRASQINPTPTPRTQDAQTYDDLGADNQEVTGWSWALAFNVQVNRSTATGLYLPEIEALLARVKPSAVGELATIEVRWYHKPATGVPNPTDARQGIATVATSRVNSGPAGEIETLSVTLTGKGPAQEISNPFGGWATTVATISSVLPSGRAAGQQVTIKGVGFSGATAVTFGGTAASAFTVVDGATIVATLPAGTSGSAPVVVTTPNGASAPAAYTRA